MDARTLCAADNAIGYSLLFYKTPWCDMLGCCGKSGSILHLYYKLEDLTKEIDMLTSTLGVHRSTETAKHLLDLINMTADNSEQFMSFAKSSMAKVFKVIAKYTKNVPVAYLFNEGVNTIEIDSTSQTVVSFKKLDWVKVTGGEHGANDLYVATEDGTSEDLSVLDKQETDFRRSIHFMINVPKNMNENVIPALDQCMFDAIKYCIIAEWMYMAFPDEEKRWAEKYNESIEEVRMYCTRLIKAITDRIPRIF